MVRGEDVLEVEGDATGVKEIGEISGEVVAEESGLVEVEDMTTSTEVDERAADRRIRKVRVKKGRTSSRRLGVKGREHKAPLNRIERLLYTPSQNNQTLASLEQNKQSSPCSRVF